MILDFSLSFAALGRHLNHVMTNSMARLQKNAFIIIQN